MKFRYTNVELNLPHHLNYVAALPWKCTQRIVHVKPLTFSANKHETLFRQTCGIQAAQIWSQSITRSGLSCNIVSTRQKSVAWMNGGWLMSGVPLNSRLSIWLLITGVENFERASLRKEDNSNTTCELTILILSVCHFQCNFCLTITVLHLSFKKCACNVDNSLGLYPCLFYKVVQR